MRPQDLREDQTDDRSYPGKRELRGRHQRRDVRQLTDDDFEEIYAAWLKYGVLRLRDQQIDEDELQSFSARFGPLEEIPFGRMSEADKAKVKNRYVTQLSNILVDGKPIGGLGNSEASWHSDMTYVEVLPRPACCLGWRFQPKAATPISPIRTRPVQHYPTS